MPGSRVTAIVALRRSRGAPVFAVVALVAARAVASFQWIYGSDLVVGPPIRSDGQRAFVEALPVFSLGPAALIETVRGRLSRPVLLLATGAFSVLAIYAMVAYWLRAIPYGGTTWHIYLRSFHTVL